MNAGQVRIGGSLSMNSEGENKASFNDVILIDAKIGGQVNMLGASFKGPLNADLLKVGGNLFAPSPSASLAWHSARSCSSPSRGSPTAHRNSERAAGISQADSSQFLCARRQSDRVHACRKNLVLIDEIAAWEHDRNANHTKADWQFTTKNARIKLKHLYPAI